MVFVCNGTSSCPVSASGTLDSFAPEPPRPLGGPGGAGMISGSLNPPRLGIGGKLLQGVTAGPGGGGEGGGVGGGGTSTGGPSALSPGFGDAGNDTQCGEQILNYGNVEKVVIGAALTLITLLTIAGNCLVVISVCFVKKLRQPSNYLIVSLALADLSVAVAVMPFVSVTDLIGGEWIFGSVFCNVFIAMDVMCCTASIMSLCVISIDSPACGKGAQPSPARSRAAAEVDETASGFAALLRSSPFPVNIIRLKVWLLGGKENITRSSDKLGKVE
ncbi:5-hydroxytryptamine receptor 7-like [Crotalus adamanteus]|uniref:5-hydroxytryptamine receptor 7-like n=1 Tax=Crotalus adamanteus TaxID=8729 RepID=A0AAW1BEM8_CROAD